MPRWGINAQKAPFILKQTGLSHTMQISNLVANQLLKDRKGFPIFVFVQSWRGFVLEPRLLKRQGFSQESILQQLTEQGIGDRLCLSLLDKVPEPPQVFL